MKRISRLILVWATMLPAISAMTQNIGINSTGAAAHASAMLDVSSTNKGMLAPRMTTEQRTTVASPAKGLLVYDTDINSLFHFNGTSWVNLSAGGGGGLTLPFAANVNLNAPAFQIENSGAGDILFLGATNGSAITAYNTGNSAAISVNATNGFGIYAQSGLSIPIYALSTNINNTLAALRANNIGGGVGLHVTASNNDGILSISSAANKVGVRGEATGTSGIGVYGTTTTNTGIGVSGFNAGGVGILGTSTSSYGVRGVTSSGTGFSGVYGLNNGTAGAGVRGEANFPIGMGVYGSSTTGIGVGGYSESNRAIQGQSISGTALYGSSTNGYSLDVAGKVKISGGNTTPQTGAVLTSIDASGNAVWKQQKIAFSVYGRHVNYTSIPHNTTRKMHFSTVEYDYAENYSLYTGGTPTANSSTFLVPINGLYHFNIKVALELIESSFTDDFTEIIATLRRTRSGNTIDVAVLDAGCCMEKDWKYFLYGGFDIPLLQGDRIHMEVTQRNDGTKSAAINIPMSLSGHLVFAD